MVLPPAQNGLNISNCRNIKTQVVLQFSDIYNICNVLYVIWVSSFLPIQFVTIGYISLTHSLTHSLNLSHKHSLSQSIK